MTLSSAHQRALRLQHARLAAGALAWAVTGSLGFALQGVPVEPHDVDLQTDGPGAYAVARLFAARVVRPVAFSQAPGIRSHFGVLALGGLRVEIMGALQKRLPDGSWEPAVDVTRHRRFVELDGMRLPVLSLAYERDAYAVLGRHDRVRMLDEWLRDGPPASSSV